MASSHALSNWIASVLMLISIGSFEWMYAAFGTAVLHAELRVAILLFLHMCLFSFFQLFSGALIDWYGGRWIMPTSAFCVLLGMVFQICTNESNFLFMSVFSQLVLTFGASFSFIGIGYISNYFFSPASGIMFGFAQASYSLAYALFGVLSFCCGTFFERNFRFSIWSIAALQFGIFLLISYCARNLPLCPGATRGFKIVHVVRHIRNIIFDPNVLRISLIGSMAFSTFFAVAAFFLYKEEAFYLFSVYAWVGFAIGSPFACWVFSRNGKRGTMAVFCMLQYFILCIMLVLQVESSEWLRYASCLTAWLFGFFSGGHMIAFSIGNNIIAPGAITTFCAVVNGFMCTFSGIVILVFTVLSQWYSLTTLLISFSCFAFTSLCLLSLSSQLCKMFAIGTRIAKVLSVSRKEP